jgi:hypothetical protein
MLLAWAVWFILLLCIVAVVVSGCATPRATQTSLPPERATIERVAGPRLSKGAVLLARLEQDLGTDVSTPGDRYSARVVSRVIDERGRTLVPEGAALGGRVVDAEVGKGGRAARLELTVDRIELDRASARVATRVFVPHQEKVSPGIKEEPIRRGAISGAVIGVILLGLPGGVLGYMVGTSGGAAVSLKQARVDLHLPAGTVLAVELESSLR